MSHLLIVGCGKLGTPLGVQLAAEGHTVTAIKRSLHPDDPAALHWLAMDITNTGQFSKLPADIDAMIVILTPAERSPDGYQRVYQYGLNQLLAHYNKPGSVPWVLFVSATSVYGQQSGEWVDEESLTEPEGYNGKSLLAAEQAVTAFSADSIVVRFSGIYGVARSRVIDKLKTAQVIQQFPPLYSNRIHQEDCIAVLHFLITEKMSGRPLDSVYLATDHDCAEKFEVMSWLAEQAGLVSPIPEIADDDAPRNKRCSNQRLLQRGYRFKYAGFRDGYKAMLAQRNGSN